jgi:hypothetical protein
MRTKSTPKKNAKSKESQEKGSEGVIFDKKANMPVAIKKEPEEEVWVIMTNDDLLYFVSKKAMMEEKVKLEAKDKGAIIMTSCFATRDEAKEAFSKVKAMVGNMNSDQKEQFHSKSINLVDDSTVSDDGAKVNLLTDIDIQILHFCLLF